MRSLKQDLLFLIAVRDCFDLNFLLKPSFRRKFLKALTVHKKDEYGEHWYIQSNVLGRYNERLGKKTWRINGRYHREDGPALICADGRQYWYKNDKKHRDDGPAIIYSNGTQTWWKNGKLHRDYGPAVEWSDGTQMWWINGKKHRDDGPAVKWIDGIHEWWINGKRVEPF